MQRITKDDWEIINAALALYEASAGDFNLTERAEEALERDIANVRIKVHDRIGRR